MFRKQLIQLVGGAIVFGLLCIAQCQGQERPSSEANEFQNQELIPHRTGGWIFNIHSPPRLVWRDAARVADLGGSSPPKVRWFDTSLTEFALPDHPGRWIAWIEGNAPNGLPLRRSHTFFALPEKIDPAGIPDLTIKFPNFPNEQTPELLREFQSEMERGAKDMLMRSIWDSERSAILLAALHESAPLHRTRRFSESSLASHAERHLALKIRRMGLSSKTRKLAPPGLIATNPSASSSDPPTSVTEQRRVDAKARIDQHCHEWAAATREPFVTLVICEDRVITHQAFGASVDGIPIDLDYRCWIASLTKTVTGILFARFVDQGLIGLDDSISTVFPDYPANSPHVPTFRQCLNHTAGFDGHGDFGGMNNPHLENVILNAIEQNEPGKAYRYSGIGFELAAKAMEIVSGFPAVKLYEQHLFQPLGFGDVILGNASSDAELTAAELATIGQLLLGRGNYQGQQFFRPETFEQLLPRALDVRDAPHHGYGVGLHWIRHRRPSSDSNSQQDRELLFSSNTIGHGSFSGCILVVDLDRRIVIAQARRNFREQDNSWFQRFFEVVSDALSP